MIWYNIILIVPTGFEPVSAASEATMLATTLRDCIITLTGFEPVPTGSRPDMLDRYTIGLLEKFTTVVCTLVLKNGNPHTSTCPVVVVSF